MFMENGEYTRFWYLQLLYLPQLQFTIGQNEFVEFFGVFRDNCRIRATWAFSIICVCAVSSQHTTSYQLFLVEQSLNNTKQAIAFLE